MGCVEGAAACAACRGVLFKAEVAVHPAYCSRCGGVRQVWGYGDRLYKGNGDGLYDRPQYPNRNKIYLVTYTACYIMSSWTAYRLMERCLFQDRDDLVQQINQLGQLTDQPAVQQVGDATEQVAQQTTGRVGDNVQDHGIQMDL